MTEERAEYAAGDAGMKLTKELTEALHKAQNHNQVVDYALLRAGSAELLGDRVLDYLGHGWELYLGPAIAMALKEGGALAVRYCQAMVKRTRAAGPRAAG